MHLCDNTTLRSCPIKQGKYTRNAIHVLLILQAVQDSCSNAFVLATSHRIWTVSPHTNLHYKALEADSIKPITITVVELEVVMEDEAGLHVGWHGYSHCGRS